MGIPNATNSTIFQKVIDDAVFNNIIDNKINKIGGYMAVASDVKHLNTPQQVYDGLRLDYSGSSFGSPTRNSQAKMYFVRFQSNDVTNLTIPRNKNNGGILNDPDIAASYNKNVYPFTGQGFTSGKNGTLGGPELKAEFGNELEVEIGEIYWLDETGKEVIVATYDKVNKVFIKVQ